MFIPASGQKTIQTKQAIFLWGKLGTIAWKTKLWFFLWKKFFKTVLCIQNSSFQGHPKTAKSWSLFALILLSLFCWWKYSSHRFPWYILKQCMAFPKQYTWILMSFDMANIRESSLQAWPWQPFRMFLPEHFCLKHKKFLKLGRIGSPSPPPAPPHQPLSCTPRSNREPLKRILLACLKPHWKGTAVTVILMRVCFSFSSSLGCSFRRKQN